MAVRSVRTVSLLAAACCVLMTGCGKQGTNADGNKGGLRQPATNLQTSNDLKQLGLAYHSSYVDSTRRPPAKAQDLAPFIENDRRLLGRLESGEIVFRYGVTLTDMLPEGTSKTIIAYEKDAPTQGGLVALGDGFVKKVSADEFKTLKLATPKKR